MPLKLVFPSSDRPQLLLDAGRYRVGSDPASEVLLSAEGAPALQCELLVGPHGVQLSIPPSQQVMVNGRAVDGLIALRSGDTIACAGERIRLVSAANNAPAGTAAPRAGDDIGATMVRPVVPRFVLRGMSGEQFGRNYPLPASVVVGRAEESTLHLPHDGISRQHARLTPANDEVLLEDLGSANGTWLNGKRINHAQARDGDEIRFDTQRFQLVAPGQARLPAPAPSRRARAYWPWVAALVLIGIAAALLR